MNSSSKGSRLIFVGGAARSGTTLVQNMLDCHPAIFGGPEFLHLNDIMKLRNKMFSSIDRGKIDIICSRDELDWEIGNMIESFFLSLADKNNSKFYSEKTPDNVLIFSDLIKIFPAAHCIHIVRDPRATIASMFQVGERGKREGWNTQDFTHSLTAAIYYIKKCLNSGFHAYKNSPEKVLTITYEKLIIKPEETTKEICKFLNIDWSERMLFPTEKKHSGEKAIVNKVWYTNEMFHRNPDAKQVDKWKKNLSTFQAICISKEFIDHQDLLRLGYNFSLDQFSVLNCFCANLYRISFLLLSKMGRKIYSIKLRNPKIARLKRILRKS
jgi:protein-tyrosine sulfotransferase